MSELDEIRARIGVLFRERAFVDALPLARRWVELAPDAWTAHADRAVAAKHARAWAECREACLRSRALREGPPDPGVHWNLGIAGTALGDWPAARLGWTGCGIAITPGDGEVQLALGLTPIRIGPRDAQEVVWCERIDPARAIVSNIPMPESGHRLGDLLLHDGEPRGKRMLGSREVSVFDALERLEPSPFATTVVTVRATSEADVAALTELFRAAGAFAEDWSASLHWMCRACSEGRPHAEHDRERGWSLERKIGVASKTRVEDDLLRTWESAGEGREIVDLRETAQYGADGTLSE